MAQLEDQTAVNIDKGCEKTLVSTGNWLVLSSLTRLNEMVTFKVGSQDQIEEFIVHKEVACHGSPVFAKAFNSEFIEGQTSTYTLDDIHPGTFRFMVDWLYTGTLHVINDCPSHPIPADKEEQFRMMYAFSNEQSHLLELWVLADKLLMAQLQNTVMAHFCESKMITAFNFDYIYNNTSADSLLRKMLLDKCIKNGFASFGSISDLVPAKMQVDLLCVFFDNDLMSKVQSSILSASDYFVKEGIDSDGDGDGDGDR